MLQMVKKKLKNQKGFTLIELLAVIVILGIIAAIAIPSITKVIQNSRVDAVRADAIAVYNAGKIYYSQHESDATFNGTFKGTDLTGSVIDNTSLTNVEFTVGNDGSLTMSASGKAGTVPVTITGANYGQISNQGNWTGSSINITSSSNPGPSTGS